MRLHRPSSGFRFLLSLLLGVLLFCGTTLPPSPAFAQHVIGYGPQGYPGNTEYGEGIYFAPYDLKIYEQASETSALLEELTWSPSGNSLAIYSKTRNTVLRPEHVFISFYPAVDVAILAVVSDTEDGWAEVVYDHRSGKTGWVKFSDANAPKAAGEPAHFGRFMTWLDFMKFNARSNGIYWLSGVSSYHRSIRMTPEDTSKLLQVTIIRDLKVKHVRGNWMLVEVLDFERNTPLGWIRWRDDNGKLMVFPNFSKTKLPVITTSF